MRTLRLILRTPFYGNIVERDAPNRIGVPPNPITISVMSDRHKRWFSR